MNRQREFQNKYHHALDKMYDLFKFGKEIEELLFVALDKARDELLRIQACPGADAEIKQLCTRALDDIRTLTKDIL